MNSGEQPWEVLAAYFSGEISDEQRASVDAWRQASPQNAALFAEAHAIWRNSELKLKAGSVDNDALWQRLKQKIDNDPAENVAWFNRTWLRVAASVALVCVVGYFLYKQPVKEQEKNTLATTVLRAGREVATVYLPDSSRVWLNVNSTLSYTAAFGQQARRVVLTGEGYFEVRPDKSRPFIVSAGNASVTVKGTSFNVQEESASVVLTVAEGVVKFGSQDSTREGVTVKAEEGAVLAHNGTVTKQRHINPAFASWRQQHNAAFDAEKTNPGTYLATQYTWHKNAINRSVIEGVLRNSASLADYSHVVLKVVYTKPNGSAGTAHITLDEPVRAGHTVRFQKRLLDILTNTRSVTVTVESAVVEE